MIHANLAVKWFNRQKGFSFLQPEGGDVIVNVSAFERAGMNALQGGLKVGCELEPDQRSVKMSAGQLQAARPDTTRPA